MITSVNPFDDPEFKKNVLAKEDDTESTVEVELNFNDDEIQSEDFRSLINSAPKIPKMAKNIILDASAISKSQKEEKAEEMVAALSNVFDKYNQEYGTDLQIDLKNLSKTLVNVSDPTTRRTLELYVSEVFKSIRPVMLLHLISRLSLALDYVLQPERMFDSNQLSIPDLFLVIEKLQEYIVNLNEIINTSTIKDSDQILKKLAEDNKGTVLDADDPTTQRAVDDFWALLMKDSGVNQ